MHVNSSGGRGQGRGGEGRRGEGGGRSLKEHLGPFIPDMKVEGNIIEAPPHNTDFRAFGRQA